MSGTELLPALVAYALPAALITMLPGPDTAMVLTTALRHGRQAAFRAAWGVGTGLVLWGFAAAAGMAGALHSSVLLYEVFRVACALYVLSLGFRALASALRGGGDAVADVPPEGAARRQRARSLGWGFKRALFTCLLNPKLGVFFVVFLPQFIPAGQPIGRFSVALASLQAVEAVCWYVLLSYLAAFFGDALSRKRVTRWLDAVTGMIFVAFGLKLLTDAGK
jgi:threonine/homoserine/homoserine lactone efflux protein